MTHRLASVLLAALLCLGCGGEQKAPPSTLDSSTVAPDDETPRDGGTIYRRLDIDAASLNPVLATNKYDRIVAIYLHTPMIHFDENLQFAPGLADSWEVSPDGLEYTFHLNPKATFSDGKPVRSSDVVFTLRKIADPTTEAPQVGGSFTLLDIAKTRAVDPHTVIVAFKEAIASQLMQFNNLLTIPEHVYSQGNFNTDHNVTAVGSGPYRLARREVGKEIVLERRDDYWGRKPYIKTVHFRVITDSRTAWNALKLGQIDDTIIGSDLWAQESRRAEHQRTIEFRRFYMLSYNYIAWNGKDPILADKRVRRALSMCVDMSAVINNLFHGTARAMSGPFTPDEWAYNQSVPVIAFDPAGAKRLLASIGWLDTDGDGVLDKDKKPLKIEMLIFAGNPISAPFAQLLQSELQRIGVQLDVRPTDPGALFQRVLAGNYQSAYLSWDTDPDPDPFAILHSSQHPPVGQNFVYYASPEADRLMEEGRRTLAQEKRIPIYRRLHEVMAADQPYTWTVQVSVKWAINKRVRGVKESKGYGIDLWAPGPFDWWVASPAAAR